MASITRQNADSTEQANHFMTEAEAVILEGGKSVAELTVVMREIAQASEQTRKIMRTIDGIALHINMLASMPPWKPLARARRGPEFAVVANEVRNLASRAAESAKNTSALTDDIVAKVGKGEVLFSRTHAALQ